MKYTMKGDLDAQIIQGRTPEEILDSIRGGSMWAESDLNEYAASFSQRLKVSDGVDLPSDPRGLVNGMLREGILIPIEEK
jgi:hypothetical protein